MSEVGIVIETMGSKVRVRIPHSEKCNGCHACSFITAEAQMEVVAINACGAIVGDQVELEITQSGELPAALILYGIPMLSFVIVTCLLLLFLSEVPAFIGGAAAVVLSYLLIKKLSGRMNTSRYLPTAVSLHYSTGSDSK